MSDTEHAATAEPIPSSNGVTSRRRGVMEETVPSFRLTEERANRDEAVARAEQATKAMEKMKAQLEAVTSELSGLQSTHTQELHLVELGFKAPSIRRFLRREYASAASEAGEDAPAFADWLDANREDPLYAPHFDRLMGGAPANTPPAASAPTSDNTDALLEAVRATLNGNPERGAGPPVAHPSKEWGSEEIRRLRAKNGGGLGEQKDAILASMRAQGLIK